MSTLALFLGAGFSHPWGLPLTKDLLPVLEEGWKPIIEKFRRRYQERLAERVQASWLKYRNGCQGSVDEFAGKLRNDKQGAMGLSFDDLAYFLAVQLAVDQSEVRVFNMQPQYIGHHIEMQKVIKPCYETVVEVLDKYSLRGIVTTNYDLVVEKILGPNGTGRLGGFHYGSPGQPLNKHHHQLGTERWYDQKTIDGTIPLLKLHGSLNWALSKEDHIEVYVDCYPSLTRGRQPLIVPPRSKTPQYDLLKLAWEKAEEVLKGADLWIFCGYSIPRYDNDVRDLLNKSASNLRRVVILSPDATTLEQDIRNILNASVSEIDVRCGPGLGPELTSLKFCSLLSDGDSESG